jgi:isopenicillin N synthase-like dioxygenase
MAFLKINGISKGSTKIAELMIIDFWRLLDGDKSEARKLVEACKHYGFFYLDLQRPGSNNILRDLDKLQSLMKDWFMLPGEVKLATPSLRLSQG